ncbi:MAG: HI0074 family nucleotidyltransferase substrate-binding subunit [Trueperaceae bacterium]
MARKALATLQSLPLATSTDDVVRDAAIQRFEYTFEATWKAAQQFLRELEGLAVASPKGSIRESFQNGLLTEEEARAAMGMADDRNLTVHTYNESLSQAIFSRLSTHAAIMGRWLQAMEERTNESTL